VGILRTAVTVGVASSVHGRIQRRQQQRWAAQDQPAGLAPPAAPPPQAPPSQAPVADTSQRLAQLRELGDLKTAGVLTDAEFEQQKARILND
jgi:putative oligomerization/nucleic acid binding protein